MKRDLAKYREWQRRSKPLPKRSKKRIREDAERAVVVAGMEVYQCEARHAPVACYGPLTTHEVKTAARRGSRTDVTNLRRVCAGHNEYLSNDGQQWGYENGLLKHSWEAS